MGATIKPHVTIGDGARIGQGAAVVRDVPAGETWVGVPARRIR
jgi:acetyltransferase-like isoleucine patch superfamily enzyme